MWVLILGDCKPSVSWVFGWVSAAMTLGYTFLGPVAEAIGAHDKRGTGSDLHPRVKIITFLMPHYPHLDLAILIPKW